MTNNLKQDLQDLYNRLVANYNDNVPFEQLEEDRLVVSNTLDLINQYEEEIEKKDRAFEELIKVARLWKEKYNDAKAESERLKNNYDKLCEYLDKKELELVEINADISWFREAKVSMLAPAIKEIKAEVIKNFAERFEAYIPNIEGETTMECVKNAIKQTLKEMGVE